MSIIMDCMMCLGRPGGCGYCGGSGIEPMTDAERDTILGDALEVLNNDGVSRDTFSVVEGGENKVEPQRVMPSTNLRIVKEEEPNK